MSWFIENVIPLLKGNFLLLLVGAYAPQPGRTERLLSRLPQKIENKISLFLGFPTDNAPLRRLLENPEVATRVKHLQRLPTEAVQLLLAQSAAFVMPNIKIPGDMEGFGLVCLEAAMAGATVFASEIDGIPDAIQDGKNGYLLPSGNAKAWAGRLNEVIANPHLNKEREVFRQYTIDHFGWDKMVRGYFGLFSSLIK